MKCALGDLTTAELFQILGASSREALRGTISSKANALKNIKASVQATYARYKREGVKEALKHDTQSAQDFVTSLPAKGRAMYYHFQSLSRDKQIEQVAVFILTLSIFFAAGGGFDFEGGIPDLDIVVGGIGAHRSIFTHTIIIGFGFEFAARFGIQVLGKIRDRLPRVHHQAWDRVYEFIDSHQNLFIGALWAGIGAHLIKDTGLLVGGVKPYVELPNGLPIAVHQTLFGANAAACELFAFHDARNH